MKNIEMIKYMFDLQEELNRKIKGPNWRLYSLPWHRAIWTECAELVESFNWKWWSKKDTDWKNIHIELVDIWHFGMSYILQYYGSSDFIESLYTDQTLKKDFDYSQDAMFLIEDIIYSLLNKEGFSCKKFFLVCQYCGLPLEKLYSLYIGKQALNKFRNDHGYTTGEYHKLWLNGKEDNDTLYELAMSGECITSEDFYNKFKIEYQKLCEYTYNN